MRQLLDDFRRQAWPMKLFLLWGWLAVVIMVSSFAATVMPEYEEPVEPAPEEQVGQD
ncbi:MAG: hypothetical protein OXH52_13720 [Gammaproteobacteria bacterium]|nr:hypothetical protein [Gammaproteobacteria bacterium]